MKLGFATIAEHFRLRGRARQELSPQEQRTQRLHRVFRGLIVALTLVALAAVWAAWPDGRLAAVGLAQRAKWRALRSVGLEPARAEIDAFWHARRARREVRTRERFRSVFVQLGPESQAFFRAAGMGPDDAVVRWGNYDMTLVMSGEVFARVDSGRLYHLRPAVRSIWVRQEGVFSMDLCVFQFPDTPEVRRLAAPAGATIIPEKVQTTNSWGCRGGEPDMDAPVRGLVLGDSFMQGYLVGDDETPPEQLRKHLHAELGTRVTILNTGTLGYCPEHYYYTLREFAERFRPQFVVVGLYLNDFGEDMDVLSGKGDWSEEQHWLELIIQHCRALGIRCMIAPVPCESQLMGVRNQGYYPGQVSNIANVSGRWFCDPTDAFIDEDLKVRTPWNPSGPLKNGRCHLYNGDLGDGHLSPAGAALWGKVVAHRLALLLAGGPETPGATDSVRKIRSDEDKMVGVFAPTRNSDQFDRK
jgi:hypothetical protein